MRQAPAEQAASGHIEPPVPHQTHSLGQVGPHGETNCANPAVLVSRHLFDFLEMDQHAFVDALRTNLRSRPEAEKCKLCIQVRDEALHPNFDDFVVVLCHMIMYEHCSHYQQVVRVFSPVLLGHGPIAEPPMCHACESSSVVADDRQWPRFFDKVKKGSWGTQALEQLQRQQKHKDELEKLVHEEISNKRARDTLREALIQAPETIVRLDWKYDDDLMLAKPALDCKFDELYRRQWLDDMSNESSSFIHTILEKATLPKIDETDGPVEVLLCSAWESNQIVGKSSPVTPMITYVPSQLSDKADSSPIEHILTYYKNIGEKVNILDSSTFGADTTRLRVKVQALIERFIKSSDTQHGLEGWSSVYLRNPLPYPSAPPFVDNSNCTLLSDIHGLDSGFINNWHQWGKLQHWALLSDGGQNTIPKIDKYGLATWMTAEEGCIGFCWNTSAQEPDKYAQNPQTYPEGSWRFVILKPGQCIFFNSGTVYFIFRKLGDRTLTLGGHVLQYSNIHRWLDIVELQCKPTSAKGYINESYARYLLSRAQALLMSMQHLEQLGVGGNTDVSGIYKRIVEVKEIIDQRVKKNVNQNRKTGKKRKIEDCVRVGSESSRGFVEG